MRTVESNEVPGAASRGARGGTADGVGSLVELLRRRASAQPRRQAYSFLLDGEADEAHLSYGELDRMARAVGGWLQAAGARGERVLLLYPPGLDYVAAFFGCLYAGAVAVPAYPPRLNRNLERLQAVATDAQPAFALTTAQTLARIESMLEQFPELLALRWQATDRLPEGSARLWREPDMGAGTLAFLQYTSGSTSLPKGVMVSHGNLLHNQRLIQATFRQTEESVIVGWLPLYHDMGLIGNVLQPLYVGARCVLMSPVAFLQRPARWLNAISRYRATTSGGPNFAYDLCARKVTEAERAALDLSSWEVAFNGAEPVRPETLERFAQTFGACGFRAEAFSPCYGLAEATLLVTGKLGSGPPVVERFRPEALERHLAVRAEEGERGLWLAGSGRSLPEQRVLIVNPETLRECAPGEVGEIWVSGPSVAGGYWNRPEETERTFGARPAGGGGEFLRTGDLGFTREGELFVTGRLKDLIIIRGVNHYPQDIELTVERAHPDLRPGSGAAFAAELGGEERLVVAQEVEPRRRPDPAGIIENVRQALALNHEVQPYAVVLLKAGSIPKTSSGKIQRAAARRAFLEGGLDVLAEWRESAPPVVPAKEAAAGPAVAGAWDTEEIERWLVSRFAATLRVEPSEIDVHAPLASYALDSLTAVELMHSIESNLGVVLPIVSFLQNQSIAQLAHDAHARLAAAPQLAP
ncbi:MAG: AMP-binding protein, partial [Acidobacteriota bacterium]|nr:AMP-binding protein [Acidobacteriota bacterium]